MKYIGLIFGSIIVISLAWAVFGYIGLGFLVIGLPLLVSISIAMEYGSYLYIIIALVGGLMVETFLWLPFGSLQVPYVLAGLGSHIVFGRYLWAQSSWKYYLSAVALSHLILLIWLQIYTMVLASINIWSFSVPVSQLWGHAPKFIIIDIIAALPVYALLVAIVRFIRQRKRNQIIV